MKMSDLLNIERIGYGLTRRYKVTIGRRGYGVDAEAKSKDDAIRAAIAKCETQETHQYQMTVRWTKDGSCWILRFVHGWQYSRYAPGSEIAGSCLLSTTSYTEALQSMLDHIKQYNEGL